METMKMDNETKEAINNMELALEAFADITNERLEELESEVAIKELSRFTDFRFSNLIKRIEELEATQEELIHYNQVQSAVRIEDKPQNSSNNETLEKIIFCSHQQPSGCYYYGYKEGKLAGLKEAEGIQFSEQLCHHKPVYSGCGKLDEAIQKLESELK